MSDPRFNIQPPTNETFAALWWGKAYHHARQALKELRGIDALSPAARQGQLFHACRHLGRAEAAIVVLFDVCHPQAHVAVHSVNRVLEIVALYVDKQRQTT